MAEWILGIILLISSVGVIAAAKPVYSALFFLLTLLSLAALYLQLSASFIAVMQILVYAGAILVLFMFVIILFQDAHAQIALYIPQSSKALLITAGVAFTIAFGIVGYKLLGLKEPQGNIPADYGSVEFLGRALYLDYFFPFEAVILLFLIAVIGSLYTAKKEF